MKQTTDKEERKSLKEEAAEIHLLLKNKNLSKYTLKAKKKRLQDVTDILCGFTDEADKISPQYWYEWGDEKMGYVSTYAYDQCGDYHFTGYKLKEAVSHLQFKNHHP